MYIVVQVPLVPTNVRRRTLLQPVGYFSAHDTATTLIIRLPSNLCVNTTVRTYRRVRTQCVPIVLKIYAIWQQVYVNGGASSIDRQRSVFQRLTLRKKLIAVNTRAAFGRPHLFRSVCFTYFRSKCK